MYLYIYIYILYIKEWGGFVGGSRFKSQWGQKLTYQNRKYINIYNSGNEISHHNIPNTIFLHMVSEHFLLSAS